MIRQKIPFFISSGLALGLDLTQSFNVEQRRSLHLRYLWPLQLDGLAASGDGWCWYCHWHQNWFLPLNHPRTVPNLGTQLMSPDQKYRCSSHPQTPYSEIDCHCHLQLVLVLVLDEVVVGSAFLVTPTN